MIRYWRTFALHLFIGLGIAFFSIWIVCSIHIDVASGLLPFLMIAVINLAVYSLTLFATLYLLTPSMRAFIHRIIKRNTNA